ncbi:hypothetical protein [Nocardioides marmoraquaticus]
MSGLEPIHELSDGTLAVFVDPDANVIYDEHQYGQLAAREIAPDTWDTWLTLKSGVPRETAEEVAPGRSTGSTSSSSSATPPRPAGTSRRAC